VELVSRIVFWVYRRWVSCKICFNLKWVGVEIHIVAVLKIIIIMNIETWKLWILILI